MIPARQYHETWQGQQENVDELYSSINHNTGDDQGPSSAYAVALANSTDHSRDELGVAGEPAHYASEATQHGEEGDGYHYHRDEWEQNNAEHGWHRDGAPPMASSPLSEHETLAAEGNRPEKHNESLPDCDHPSQYETGGGEGQVVVQRADGVGSGAQAGGDASNDTAQGELGGLAGKEIASPSSAAEVAATGTPIGGELDSDVVGRQKEEQLGNAEDSDNLYDIDDHGLSSSDDD